MSTKFDISPIHNLTINGYKNKMTGRFEVFIDGKPLNPHYEVINHSPDGFSWGYAGSGCAQLAVAILKEYFIEIKRNIYFSEDSINKIVYYLHQSFKFDMIAPVPMQNKFQMEFLEVWNWLNRNPEKKLKIERMTNE